MPRRGVRGKSTADHPFFELTGLLNDTRFPVESKVTEPAGYKKMPPGCACRTAAERVDRRDSFLARLRLFVNLLQGIRAVQNAGAHALRACFGVAQFQRVNQRFVQLDRLRQIRRNLQMLPD